VADKVRIGIVGTSWWADAMYLPPLTRHPLAEVRSIVGGARREHTREFAAKWNIPSAYDTVDEMLDSEPLDAVIVLTTNKTHVPVALAAIERGLHVLCEKPLGTTSAEARHVAETAEAKGLITMVPFTYRHMPGVRYMKELVDQGYVGTPYHLNFRYFAWYARQGEYLWRFDLDEAGSGVAGDLGSHFVYLARWFFGEVRAVTAVFGHSVPRVPRPDGVPYTQTEDSAIILLEFENGATGNIHVSAVAHEPSAFGQRHQMELHGSAGTLHHLNDWDRVQRVDGSQPGDAGMHELPIPDHIWGEARRDVVHDTYKDVFRLGDFQSRAFVSAVAAGRPVTPDFADGLAVQRIIDAAARSAAEGRRVTIAEIVAAGG
jgi:predicted dehydrogenase